MSQHVKVHRAVVPIYLAERLQPELLVRIERTFTDHQRRGFFKIGVLPVFVAEGVVIEVLREDEAAEALAALREWMQSRAGERAVELRGVIIVFASEFEGKPTTKARGDARPTFAPGRELKAGRVRFADGGQWKLFDGVEFSADNQLFATGSAVLQITGEHAGALTTADRITFNVLTTTSQQH